MHGILNCYKTPGQTSRDVVNTISRHFRASFARDIKVGHAGTLDPLAEGVLVITVGAASRLVPYLHLYSKTYRAAFRFGCQSDSGDLECPLRFLDNAPIPARVDVESAARRLTGTIVQIPPKHSAIKVNGKRAYKAARSQTDLEMPPRQVTVQRFEILDYNYPDVSALIECSTGTYVRTLGMDLAAELGTVAVMTHLLRDAIGPFGMDSSIRIERNRQDNSLEKLILTEHLRPLADGVGRLPRVDLEPLEISEIEFGRSVRFGFPKSISIVTPLPPDGLVSEEWAAFDSAGRLRAILVARDGGLGPKRVFPAS